MTVVDAFAVAAVFSLFNSACAHSLAAVDSFHSNLCCRLSGWSHHAQHKCVSTWKISLLSLSVLFVLCHILSSSLSRCMSKWHEWTCCMDGRWMKLIIRTTRRALIFHHHLFDIKIIIFFLLLLIWPLELCCERSFPFIHVAVFLLDSYSLQQIWNFPCWLWARQHVLII